MSSFFSKMIFTIMALAGGIAMAAPADTVSIPLGFQALIKDPSGNKIDTNGGTVSVNLMVLAPTFSEGNPSVAKTCVIRHETINAKITEGVLRVKIGSGAPGSLNPTSSATNLKSYIWAVFSNNPSYYNGETFQCLTTSGTTTTSTLGSNLPLNAARKLRVSFTYNSTLISADFDMTSVGHSLVASTLNGFGDFDFLKLTGTRTQGTYETLYDRLFPVAAAAIADGATLQWNSTTSNFQPVVISASTPPVTSVSGATGAVTISYEASGTTPNFSTSGSDVKLKIPMASASGVTAGLLSKVDYDSFNGKLSSSSGFAGDVTGTQTSLTLTKIQGKSVAPSTYSAGQVLRFDGSKWVNALVNGTSDISGVIPVGNGGTGASTFTAKSLLVGNGAGAFTEIAPGANGQVLTSSGGVWTVAAPSTGAFVDLSSAQTIGGAKTFSANTVFANSGTTTFNGAANFTGATAFGGAATFAGNISIGNGTASAPALALGGATSTGFFYPANGELGISTGGIERIHVTNGGNVGIGTNTPSSSLEVAGGISASGSIFAGLGTDIGFGGGSSRVNADNTQLGIYVNSVRRLQIKDDGHISLGGANASPAVSGCGSGASVSGNDVRGMISLGASPSTTCNLTFNRAYSGITPTCVVSFGGTGPQTVGISSDSSLSGFTVYMTGVPTTAGPTIKINYICMQ